MGRQLLYTTTLLLLAFVPVVAHAADLEITEVMYDVDGTDSGREWLEVFNTTDQSIDIAEWEFYENETNHGLSARKDGAKTQVAADSYAVIAADPDKFLADYPSFSSVVVDSAFSLTNSGEEIALRTPEGQLVAELSYQSQEAADGTGNSLQLSAGEWIAARATPGDTNRSEPADPQEEEENDDADSTDSSSDAGGTHEMLPRDEDDIDERDITADAGTNKTEVAGVAIHFSGTFEEDGAETDTYDDEARWSLGNGAIELGANTRFIYEYPGTYVATLSIEEVGEVFEDAVAVKILPQRVSVSAVTDSYIELTSGMAADVDLGGWRLEVSGDSFMLPERTILLSEGVLKISHNVSGFTAGGVAKLALPDGTLATSSQKEVRQDEAAATTSSERGASSQDKSEKERLFGDSTASPAPAVAGARTAQAPSTASKNPPPANTLPQASRENQTDEEVSLAQSQAQASATATRAASQPRDVLAATSSGNVAAAGVANVDPELFWQWALLLLLLSGAGVVAVLMLRRASQPRDGATAAGDQYSIEEL